MALLRALLLWGMENPAFSPFDYSGSLSRARFFSYVLAWSAIVALPGFVFISAFAEASHATCALGRPLCGIFGHIQVLYAALSLAVHLLTFPFVVRRLRDIGYPLALAGLFPTATLIGFVPGLATPAVGISVLFSLLVYLTPGQIFQRTPSGNPNPKRRIRTKLEDNGSFIRFHSQPAGATVTLNPAQPLELGKTPCVLNKYVLRSEETIFQVSLKGYRSDVGLVLAEQVDIG